MPTGKIFISYQRDSAPLAQRVRDALIDAGFDAWLDTDRIRHSDQWSMTIDQALRTADRIVVLLSQKANDSKEVFNEWFYFYQNQKPIHMIRLENCNPHYQLLPFQRLEWIGRPENDWPLLINDLVTQLNTAYTWPDNDSSRLGIVTTPFAPDRSLPGSFAALEQAIRHPDQPIALSEAQLLEIRTHQPGNSREYLLSCYARWCMPQFQLDRRFVHLTLVVDEGTDSAERWVTYPSTRSSNDLGEVLRASDSFAHVLLGAPGAGKTTLLRRLEMDVAREGIRNLGRPTIPFSVSLSEYALSSDRRSPGPLAWLEQRWNGRQSQLPPLRELLSEGRTLLLLDGLNEIAHSDSADLRFQIDAWRAFLYDYVRDVPGNRALFTCRTLDYGAMLSSKDVGVPHIRLEPMTSGQVIEYIRLHLPEHADIVTRTLTSDPRIMSFYRTPYMLRLLVNQVRTVGTVPVGRVDAFTGLVRELLRREILAGNQRLTDHEMLTDREQRRLRSGAADPLWLPDRGHLIPALTRLAYQMQNAKHGTEKGTVIIDYDTAVRLLNGLSRLAEASLRLGSDTGILDDDEETIRFFHQLLQEFFAARQLATDGDVARLRVEMGTGSAEPPLGQVLASLAPGEPLPPLQTTGWEETAVMAAALTRAPDTFVRAVMEVNPVVAGRCLAAPDVNVTDQVRRDITEALATHLTDPGVDLRARLQIGRILGAIRDPRYQRVSGTFGKALVPEFASIPAGSYQVGAHGTSYPLERPVHEVEVRGFEMARWPVTNAEYALFMSSGGYNTEEWWHSDHARRWRSGEGTLELIALEWRKKRDGLRRRPQLPVQMLKSGAATLHHAVSMVKLIDMSDDDIGAALAQLYGAGAPQQPAYWGDSRLGHPSHPVVGVSVFEAEAYCNWLSAVTGTPIRLATEYEWEVAASPHGDMYAYAGDFDPFAANTFELHLRATSPVGVFPDGASPHGCFDLTGNVFEWTSSAPSLYPHRTDLVATDAPESVRICRGGSWRHHAMRARASYRGRGQCFVRNDDLGFRLVRG